MKPKRALNAAYIHIPFCLDKCYYCNFISFSDKKDLIEEYLKSLYVEIERELSKQEKINLKSIYIGGGTPSILDASCYSKILDIMSRKTSFLSDIEITIEANPATIDINYLKSLLNAGINRISIGVQSFNEGILKSLNRKHTSKDAIDAINMAHEAGFNNISIDLMYGLPDQTLEIWHNTLNIAINSGIKHISAYGLKIEEETPFAKNLPEKLPCEESCVEMYLEAIDILTEAGYEHYEISNYAVSGYESRHNLSYWLNEEYFGFGLGAHGYVNGIRYSNSCNLDQYINDPLKKESAKALSNTEIIEEGIFLGLRLTKGINIQQFQEEYGIDILKKHKNTVDKYIRYGYMEFKEGCLSLTDSGILISNTILADFIT